MTNGEEVGVDDWIGDDVLNEIDRITKHIVDQYKDPEAGVSNMEEWDVVGENFERLTILRMIFHLIMVVLM